MKGQIITGETANGILGALPESEALVLAPDLERVMLSPGQVLSEAGARFSHVYFPEESICSYIGVTADAETVELFSVGREGITNTRIIVGEDRAPYEFMCTVGGSASRMRLDAFRARIEELPLLRTWTMRCAASVLVFLEQAGLCYCHHLAGARLARWLMLAHDRIGSNEIPATQELLARIVGVHRPAVNVAVGQLQNAGAIGSRWGRIAILDRKKLEGLSCECYGAIVANSPVWRLLGRRGPYPARSPTDVGSAKAD